MPMLYGKEQIHVVVILFRLVLHVIFVEMEGGQVLFLNPNICCGYLKNRSQCDSNFEHPKHMFFWKVIIFISRIDDNCIGNDSE